MNWVVCILTVLHLVNIILACKRIPEATTAAKSPADGRYVIKISGTTDKYEPGKRYIVSLMGIQSVSPPSHTFKEFFLTVENESADPRNATDSSVIGSFDLIDDTLTKFSTKCQNLITHTNTMSKTKIQVYWTAPAPGSGCVLIRATVVEHYDVWYMDDGPLTKRLCEVQQDDVDYQGQILGPCCACNEAKYELIFEGKWSRHTHPKDFPADNWRTGFSDIIGASHTIDYRFWQYGELARDGLREVAEHGSTRKLESELKEQSNQIRTIIKARGLSHPNVTGKTFAVFRVDSKHHLISLVSMIQPSPDWIVGVSGLELCLQNCSWVEHKIHDLFPWDAGTDRGPSYLSSDEPEKHPDVIRRIKSNFPNDPRSPFYDPTGAPMKPLARLHISRRRLYQKNCNKTGIHSEPMECATHPWGKWSECSSKCGPGKRYRTREFKNEIIARQFECKTRLQEESNCVGKKCSANDLNLVSMEPAECALSAWSEWSGCSAACGKGTRTRSREYLNKKDAKICPLKYPQKLQQTEVCEGADCSGDIPEEEAPIPDDCRLTDWSDWSPCNVSCGQGWRSRQREILSEPMNGVDPCADVKTLEIVTCSDDNCNIRPHFCNEEPTEGPCRGSKLSTFWYYDSNTKTCGIFAANSCNNDKNKFSSREECLKTCEERAEINSMTIENLRREGYLEKIDCKVSEWEIHPCKATCGEGYQLKTRKVIRPPMNGGKPCPRRMYRIEKCFVRCPIDYTESVHHRRGPISMSYTLEEEEKTNGKCRYSEWSPWTSCSATCGDNSIRHKMRTLLNPELSYKCNEKIRIQRCNVPPCYV